MSNPSEEMATRWLGGRGTKLLYFAVILAIIGTLYTAQSMSSARAKQETSEVEIQQAVKLAHDVDRLCTDREFKAAHGDTCLQAAELLADPATPRQSGGGAEIYVVQLEPALK